MAVEAAWAEEPKELEGREVTAATGALARNLERVEHQAERLIKRLSPVLAPASEKSPTAPVNAVPPPRSPLAGDLYGLADRLDRLSERLAETRSSVQV